MAANRVIGYVRMIDMLEKDTRAQKNCTALCTATAYKLPEMMEHFAKQNAEYRFFKSSNVIYRPFGLQNGAVFYFSYGVIVHWGLSKAEEIMLLEELKTFEEARLEHAELEESTYKLGDALKVVRDEITITSEDSLYKLAVSHGLAQSVKLAVFEKIVMRLIENTKHIPESLAQRGRIELSRNKINRMMGQIFIERNLVNLQTDVLDTPEFFWEFSDYEPPYRMIVQDLDMAARIEVLNRRLNIVHELFQMLDNQLTHRHSITIEWIIVGLIFIEIVLGYGRWALESLLGTV
jgi:uncharacterized Rmd1/YagE family protein